MGKRAKYHSQEERKAARAQRARDSAKKRQYDVEYRRRKQNQERSQECVTFPSNDEVYASTSAESDENISRLNGVVTATEEPPVVAICDNPEAWGGTYPQGVVFFSFF
jgi:hypothetical protein